MHDNTLAGDFAFSKLIPTLNEFKVPAHQQSKVIAWFWQNAKTWTAESQAEFVNIARINLAAKLGSHLPTPKPKHPKPWTPCAHFGGDRKCERCQSKETEAGLIYEGVMARAQKMFEKYRLFVRGRLRIEIFPWSLGKKYEHFDEVEGQVWANVAARIGSYAPQASPTTGKEMQMAWLRTVVHSTVADYFESLHRKKRGADKIVPLDFDPVNQASPVSIPTKPTSPAGEAPDAEDKDSSYGYAREETMGRGRMAK